MYQVDILFEKHSQVPSQEELTVIIEDELRKRGYAFHHVSAGWSYHRTVMALKDGVPVGQKMSEREAQGFAHNYPGMHLFFMEGIDG